jgi:CCR4-NOT transcriptional regulation complex NOT5 subunit
MDNDVLSIDDIDPLKDDLDYYLEANTEQDFLDNYGDDDIYEELDLDAVSSLLCTCSFLV